jgi:hypothetical protein
MQPEAELSCSQQPATGPYIEAVQSYRLLHNIFI